MFSTKYNQGFTLTY